MKATIALVLSTISLAVALTGITLSSAADPGVVDYCITNLQVVERIPMTINGHTRLVLVNAGPKSLRQHKSTFIVPTMRPECVAP